MLKRKKSTRTWCRATPATEGTALTLGTLAATVNSLNGDSNSLQSLVVSGIPVGDTLSDGHGHSFTATAGNTQVDVNGWTLSSLTILTVNEANFTLTATATVVDVNDETSTAFATESVTVNPKAATVTWGPATPATEGTALTLGTLAAKIGRATCRESGLQSVVVGGMAISDTLNDGHGQGLTRTG